LKTNDHSAPQCAAFYLALLIGVAPTTSIDISQEG
jgi:hypothetical protein